MDKTREKNNIQSPSYKNLEHSEPKDNVSEPISDGTAEAEVSALQETVEVEETELVEESTLGKVILGEDEEFYLVLSVSGPDIDIEKLDSVQILGNDDGTETVLLEIDELSEAEISTVHDEKQSEVFQSVELVDIDKQGKIMQQLFGNASGYDPYHLGKLRRNRVFGTYSCPECDQTFINTARLERHLAVHQISGSFECPLCQKIYKYEYNLFYHWRRTCHELSELMPVEKRRTMDVNVLRSLVMKIAQKKAEEAPPPAMRIGINPNLLLRSDAFSLVDMQAPLNNQSGVQAGIPCKQCGVKLSSSVMQWHVAMHRGAIAVDTRNGSLEHFCSLCGMMFRQRSSLIKHWRSGCSEIQARLSDTRDLSMDDDTLKDMVADIMREMVQEYLQRFGKSSQDDEEIMSSSDLFPSSEKEKNLSVTDYQQDAVSHRVLCQEAFTNMEVAEGQIVDTEDRQSSAWHFDSQDSGSAASSTEPNPVRTKWSSTHGMVQCSVCSRTFVNISRLERHIAGFHASTGSHPCMLCGNRFKYDYNLLSHYRRTCPYTKLYIDADKREELDALALRRAVRTLAQNNLQLDFTQKKMVASKHERLDSPMVSSLYFPVKPPYELMVMRPDLPNGKSCPVCGVVFYGENAVDRHMRAVHVAEFNQYFANERRRNRNVAFSAKQRHEEVTEKPMNVLRRASNTDDESPPTLAPEVPVQEMKSVVCEPIVRRVSRIGEDADGNQIFVDGDGQVIELGEDEELHIQFDDFETVHHLFETNQLSMPTSEPTIILERSDPKYCYNMSGRDRNIEVPRTGSNQFGTDEKRTDFLLNDGGCKKARKHEFGGHSQNYGLRTLGMALLGDDDSSDNQPLVTFRRTDHSETEPSSVTNLLHELPLARVKLIMQSGGEQVPVSSEGLFAMTKAAELFLRKLAKESYEVSDRPKCVEYSHLAEYVQENDSLEFLHEMIPRMVRFADVMHLVQPTILQTGD